MVLRIINILLVGFDHDILVAKKFRNSYLILMFSIWFIVHVISFIAYDLYKVGVEKIRILFLFYSLIPS